ncbi:MAG: acetolactate synthase small subunit [Candidatus Latescibacteria bacterium]|nr:acetolactate synthase small subunit [Candidatus Latescibacterota bacterium]
MRHIISVIVENKFGVLARVSGLFSSRGYNIDSLTVGETNDPEVSRMTIVVKGDDSILDQVMKQLNKLVDVIEVVDLPREQSVRRELCLIKVNCNSGTRTEILEIANVFRAKTIHIGHTSLIIQITGTEEKINGFINLMEPFKILEVARTGVAAMQRESKEQ